MTVGPSLCKNTQEDSWSILQLSTLLESKSIYYPVPELMTQVSGLSKLIAILIALPYFMAQKPITYLNISVMVYCVMRNGWLSFAQTQFRSQSCGTHAVSSGYLLLSHRTSHSLIYMLYISHKIIYVSPNFIALRGQQTSTNVWTKRHMHWHIHSDL